MRKTNLKPNIRELTLERGMSFPTDEELLMMIIGSGTKSAPVETLAKQVNSKLLISSAEERIEKLLQIKGLGEGKTMAICAALELGRRKSEYKNAVIRTPKDIVPFVQSYSMQSREHFLCVTLNGGKELIQIKVISVGTVSRTIVHPREIFIEALTQNAAAIIICHNHPSGNPEPSQEDINTTITILEASRVIGIPLLDHIIIEKNSYFSFVEHNLVFGRKRKL